jgi:hypothetical protein
MTREQIVALARDAGMFRLFGDPNAPEALGGAAIERFAKLVIDDYSNKHAQLWLKRIDLATKLAYVAGQLDMRERAFGVCEDIAFDALNACELEDNPVDRGIELGAAECASAIRALPIEGETK